MGINKWFNYESVGSNGRINLICFPYSGGSASYYAPWKNSYPEEINILPVAYPMRELRMKEEMPGSLVELAESFAEDNEELFDAPFAFFGHCTGALVAYETAKYIQKNFRKSPKLFFASSSASPSCIMFAGKITDASDDIMLAHLVDDGIINVEFARQDICRNYILPILRKDLQLHEEYRCETADPMKCRIVAAYGIQDKLLTDTDAADWSRFTINSFRAVPFNDGHFYLNTHGDKLRELIVGELLGEL